MPTLQKAQLDRSPSVWLEPADRITALVFAKGTKILTLLGFYEEHRAADVGGHFEDILGKFAYEVLSEIAGALVEAANTSDRLQRATLVSTLRRIAHNPQVFWEHNLPGEVEWAIAECYKRSDEGSATDCLDIIGNERQAFEKSAETEVRVKNAACAALERHQKAARAGRPRNFANGIIGDKLGGIFLRYNDNGLTRHSSACDASQKEGGPFYEFVDLAIAPLQQFLRERGLPPVTVATIVRLAIQFRYGKM